MGRVVVAGVVSVRVAQPVPRFPVPFAASRKLTGRISVRLASSGWTIARTIQSLGTAVDFATYVGDDPLGAVAVRGLRATGLYGPATLTCPDQPRSVVLYDAAGRVAGARDLCDVAQLRYPIEVFDRTLPCDLAVLTNIAFTRPLLDAASKRGVPIATDVHLATEVAHSPYPDWLRAAGIVACSHAALTGSAERWINELWQHHGTELALVGCAGDGALLGVRRTRRIWWVPGVTPRGVSYPGGAGDTLLGAFAHYLVDSGDPVAALRRAVLVSGWKVGGNADEEAGVTPDLLAGLGLPQVVRMR